MSVNMVDRDLLGMKQLAVAQKAVTRIVEALDLTPWSGVIP
jgi:hypothetical protein